MTADKELFLDRSGDLLGFPDKGQELSADVAPTLPPDLQFSVSINIKEIELVTNECLVWCRHTCKHRR